MPSSRILAQARGQTSAATAYNPGIGVRALIYHIIIANVDQGATTFSLFLDDDGTTYDDTTAIADTVSCGSGIVVQYDFEHGLPMNLNGGNLAILSSVNDSHTFTVIGEEKQ